jgi:uncharacterized membrane protein
VGDTIRAIAPDRAKRLFFVLMAACLLLVIYTDERFLIDARDPEWKHIAPFKWPLLIHGLAAATALLIGPLQFSDTIRRTRPALHRAVGWTYAGAVLIAAPAALYIGMNFKGPIFAMEVPAQAGLWLLTTIIALVCILRRSIPPHRAWMMKSYCFALIFVVSRVPDVIPVNWSETGFVMFQWYLTIAALVGPEIALTLRRLVRSTA